MNQKTDNENKEKKNISEFSPSFVKLVIVLTVSTLIVAFLMTTSFANNLDDFPGIRGGFTVPWMVAMGLTITQGIYEFGGKLFSLGISYKIYLLTSILLIGVVAPTLMIFGLKNAYQKSIPSNEEKKYIFYPHSVQLILSSIVLVSVFILSTFSFYSASNIYEKLKIHSAIEENSDNIVSELMELCNEARQIAILPYELGGGNGSFVLTKKNIEEKKYVELNSLKSFASAKEANYFLVPYKSDSLMTIVAVSKTKCSDPNFSNYNGQKGFVQVIARITKDNSSIRVESTSRFN